MNTLILNDMDGNIQFIIPIHMIETVEAIRDPDEPKIIVYAGTSRVVSKYKKIETLDERIKVIKGFLENKN